MWMFRMLFSIVAFIAIGAHDCDPEMPPGTTPKPFPEIYPEPYPCLYVESRGLLVLLLEQFSVLAEVIESRIVTN